MEEVSLMVSNEGRFAVLQSPARSSAFLYSYLMIADNRGASFRKNLQTLRRACSCVTDLDSPFDSR